MTTNPTHHPDDVAAVRDAIAELTGVTQYIKPATIVIDALRAAEAKRGMVLVPREPTQAMIRVGAEMLDMRNAASGGDASVAYWTDEAKAAWEAMIAAASGKEGEP